MTEEGKLIMEFLQTNSEEARAVAFLIFSILGSIIIVLFALHKKVGTTDSNLLVVKNDVEHIKSGIEDLKNK